MSQEKEWESLELMNERGEKSNFTCESLREHRENFYRMDESMEP